MVRVLLITHADTAYNPSRYTNELVVALGERVSLTIVEWEHMAAPSASAAAEAARVHLTSIDTILFYVKYRHHVEALFDWSGFDGFRVWFEQDAWHSYNPGNPSLQGQFAPLFHRNGFHRMLTSGHNARDLLPR